MFQILILFTKPANIFYYKGPSTVAHPSPMEHQEVVLFLMERQSFQSRIKDW